MIELILFGSFLIFLLLGVPVAFSMGLSAFGTILYSGGLSAFAPASGVLYAGLTSETLLAIPFFILAGTIMEISGISTRLIEFADACVGHRKTGIALTTIIVALMFSSITGSGPATVAAIGGMLIPALAKQGYSKRHSAALVASAGEMGIIIPPSIAYIVFAVVASDYERISIGRLFIAGIVPGVILLLAFYCVAIFLPRNMDIAKANVGHHVEHARALAGSAKWSVRSPSREAGWSGGAEVPVASESASAGTDGKVTGQSDEEPESIDRKVSEGNTTSAVLPPVGGGTGLVAGRTTRAPFTVIWRATYRAFPGLLVPVIILGGIYGGIFTPTESAAVACVYGIVVGLVITRQLSIKEFAKVFIRAGLMSSRIMLIVATATLFAYVITRNQIADAVAEWMLSLTDSVVVLILCVNLLLLIAGMFIDAVSAYYLFVPLFAPVLLELGMDMTTMGVMMTMNLALGLVTPPVGVDLFVAAGIARIPFLEAVKGIWPFLGVALVVLMLVTFVPVLSNGLPDLLGL